VISNRVVLSSSAIDQSSLIDTNNDKKTDIERWYRGSQIAFEKIDEDYDGYWDKQGRRHSDGSFDVHYIYPKKKYSVKSHHIFYASRDHPENVTILAR
jgi:hypothetical protein